MTTLIVPLFLESIIIVMASWTIGLLLVAIAVKTGRIDASKIPPYRTEILTPQGGKVNATIRGAKTIYSFSVFILLAIIFMGLIQTFFSLFAFATVGLVFDPLKTR